MFWTTHVPIRETRTRFQLNTRFFYSNHHSSRIEITKRLPNVLGLIIIFVFYVESSEKDEIPFSIRLDVDKRLIFNGLNTYFKEKSCAGLLKCTFLFIIKMH